ncbi:MAG: hypothetical protein WA057_01935 [Candidatus Magasanikiibacteriota bacterium]
MPEPSSPELTAYFLDHYSPEDETKKEKKELPLEIEAKFIIHSKDFKADNRQKTVMINYYYEKSDATQIAMIAGLELDRKIKPSVVRLRIEQTGQDRKCFIAIKNKKTEGTSTRVELETEISEQQMAQITMGHRPTSKLVKEKYTIPHDLKIDDNQTLPIKLEITRITEAGAKPVTEEELPVWFVEVETTNENDLAQVRKHVYGIDLMKDAVDVSSEKEFGMKNLSKTGVDDKVKRKISDLLPLTK